MNPSKDDVPAGDDLAEVKPKIRRRPSTPVVVRPPRTTLISREEFERAVNVIAILADRPGGEMPDDSGPGQRWVVEPMDN